MITLLLFGIFCLLLLLVLPKVFRFVWFAALSIGVIVLVIGALVVLQDISRHGF